MKESHVNVLILVRLEIT